MAKDCPPAIDGATVAAVDRLSHALNCVGDALVALDGDALLSAEVDLSAATASVAVGPDAGDRHALLDAVRRARFALLRCRRLGHRLPACRAPWAASAGSATDTTARAATSGAPASTRQYRSGPDVGSVRLSAVSRRWRPSRGLSRGRQNIANINTPGTRRTVELSASLPIDPYSAGNGVDIVGIRAERADLLEAQLRHELPAQGREAAMADSLSQLRPPLASRQLDRFEPHGSSMRFRSSPRTPTSGVAGNR